MLVSPAPDAVLVLVPDPVGSLDPVRGGQAVAEEAVVGAQGERGRTAGDEVVTKALRTKLAKNG